MADRRSQGPLSITRNLTLKSRATKGIILAPLVVVASIVLGGFLSSRKEATLPPAMIGSHADGLIGNEVIMLYHPKPPGIGTKHYKVVVECWGDQCVYSMHAPATFK
jgi:hypothetical protein